MSENILQLSTENDENDPYTSSGSEYVPENDKNPTDSDEDSGKWFRNLKNCYIFIEMFLMLHFYYF